MYEVVPKFSKLFLINKSKKFDSKWKHCYQKEQRKRENHSSRKIEFCNLSQVLFKLLFSYFIWVKFSNFYKHPSSRWGLNQRCLIQNWKIIITRSSEREGRPKITQVGKLNFAISLKHCSNPCSQSFLTFIYPLILLINKWKKFDLKWKILLSREAVKERAGQEINQRWKLLLAICLDQIAFCKLSQPLQGHLFIVLDCSCSQLSSSIN